MSPQIETDVLIIGSGPADGSAALFLSSYGIPNMVITKYHWTASPKHFLRKDKKR